MSLTSLANTVWIIRQDAENITDTISASLNFTAGDPTLYNGFYGAPGSIYYDNGVPNVVYSNGWLVPYPQGATLTISNGADVESAQVISWFETNATQVVTQNLSKVKLPDGNTYNIYDSEAYHGTVGNGALTIQANGNTKGTFSANQSDDSTINITAADLGLGAALKFKGSKAYAEIIALTNAELGDVWLDPATGKEYVCIKAQTVGAEAWEVLGFTIDVSNKVDKTAYNAHTHTISASGTGSASNISGTASIPADKAVTSLTNSNLKVKKTGSAELNVTKDLSVLTGATPESYEIWSAGTDELFNYSEVTIPKYTIGSVTASKATATTAISVPNTTIGTDVSVNSVTSAGNPSTWSFTYNAGTLIIDGANSTAATTEVKTITPAVAGTAISIPQFTFADATASTVTANGTYAASNITGFAQNFNVLRTEAPGLEVSVLKDISFTDGTAVSDVSVKSEPTYSLETVSTAESGTVSVTTSGTKGAFTGTISGTAAGQNVSVSGTSGTPSNPQ